MQHLARAILNAGDEHHPARMLYGVASAANTVQINGSTTAVALPYITPVVSGDYVLILASGADRIIVGPVTQP